MKFTIQAHHLKLTITADDVTKRVLMIKLSSMNEHYSHLHQAQVTLDVASLISTFLATFTHTHQSIKRLVHWLHKRHHFFVAISWATNVSSCTCLLAYSELQFMKEPLSWSLGTDLSNQFPGFFLGQNAVFLCSGLDHQTLYVFQNPYCMLIIARERGHVLNPIPPFGIEGQKKFQSPVSLNNQWAMDGAFS